MSLGDSSLINSVPYIGPNTFEAHSARDEALATSAFLRLGELGTVPKDERDTAWMDDWLAVSRIILDHLDPV